MEEKIFERTRSFWDQAVQSGNLIYPNEQVIRFVKRNFINPKGTTILDFGCGAGRDTVALLSEGYNMIAMDYNESALRMVKNKCTWLREDVYIIQNKGFEVPLQENAVDAVIADGSLFYYSKEDLIHLLANLKRVMKPGALLWASFRTPRDSLHALGRQISKGLFELDERTDRPGCTYYFADEIIIREILSSAGLEIVSIDDFSYTSNNRATLDSWVHVVAKKTHLDD